VASSWQTVQIRGASLARIGVKTSDHDITTACHMPSPTVTLPLHAPCWATPLRAETCPSPWVRDLWTLLLTRVLTPHSSFASWSDRTQHEGAAVASSPQYFRTPRRLPRLSEERRGVQTVLSGPPEEGLPWIVNHTQGALRAPSWLACKSPS